MVLKREPIAELDRIECVNDDTPINKILLGKSLSNGFEYSMLKTAFRSLVLNIHPDQVVFEYRARAEECFKIIF